MRCLIFKMKKVQRVWRLFFEIKNSLNKGQLFTFNGGQVFKIYLYDQPANLKNTGR